MRTHVLAARPMNSRPGVGLVHTEWKMLNQHGDAVLSMDGWGMFRMRPVVAPGTPAGA